VKKNEKRVKTPLKIPLKHGIFILKAFLNLLLNAVASLKNALILFQQDNSYVRQANYTKDCTIPNRAALPGCSEPITHALVRVLTNHILEY
jgi:hypothetical protein